ncbi:MAG: peroxiredoxin-like protein [Crocinitomicaceae bacterium]|jgi:peroxiredoxin-like protein
MNKHEYNVSLVWKEGRKGEITSPELNTEIEVATPPQFDKGVAGIWSPEPLFTASVLSCYMTTFLAIADYSKLEHDSFDCSAIGVLEQIDGKYLMTVINLSAQLRLPNSEKKDRAERILQKAEAACLITNSIKSAVTLTSNITTKN